MIEGGRKIKGGRECDRGRERGRVGGWVGGREGELNEGQNWEAIMLASKEKLGNLIVIVDRNNIQIDGFTENIMPLENLAKKWESFNWHVIEMNGHDFKDIDKSITEAKNEKERPSVIIAHTIPGCGVKEFENDFHWHGIPPNKEPLKAAFNI